MKWDCNEALHSEKKPSFGKHVFFSLTPLLGQQTSAAVIVAGFKHDFIILVSLYSSILHNLKLILAKIEISGMKLFSFFLLFCQFKKIL